MVGLFGWDVGGEGSAVSVGAGKGLMKVRRLPSDVLRTSSAMHFPIEHSICIQVPMGEDTRYTKISHRQQC